MSSNHLSVLSICITLFQFLSYVNAVNDTSVASGNSTFVGNSTSTIAFSSAVQLAASVSIEVSQLATTPAVPLPTNITAIPEYAIVSKLVPGLPIVQDGVLIPDTEEMISQLIASTNSSNSSTASSLTGRQAGLRVMIVGDSMTQGAQGDFTWRYRIWQWFQKNGIAATFVGPISGTVEPAPASAPQPPPLFGQIIPSTDTGNNGGYAKAVDAAFLTNNHHFAFWGRAAAVDKGLIQATLEQNPADLMLLMLGFNDMGWFYSDAGGTIESIGELIANARNANPNLKFAVANVPQRKFIGGRQDLVENTNIFNSLLPTAIAGWTTTQSPIHLVHLEETYVCQPDNCPAGKRHLHHPCRVQVANVVALSQDTMDCIPMPGESFKLQARSHRRLLTTSEWALLHLQSRLPPIPALSDPFQRLRISGSSLRQPV
jgi:hypothetical protein